VQLGMSAMGQKRILLVLFNHLVGASEQVANGIAMPSVLAVVMLIVRNLRVDRGKRTRRMNRWVLPFSKSHRYSINELSAC
jgi:hypothetical protein